MASGENAVQQAILGYLKENNILAWRQNNQPIYDQKMNSGYGGYRAHSGMKGVPDILFVLDGRAGGIECKTTKGRQSADQLLFQKRFELHGGVYILARSVDDVSTALHPLLQQHRRTAAGCFLQRT
jgi:hypothetical protein